MKRRDWYFLVAGPVLLGLAVMGCSEGSGVGPASAGTSPTPTATAAAPASSEAESEQPASTELAVAGANRIELSVPGMH